MANPVGFKGYNIAEEKRKDTSKFTFNGQEFTLS